MKRHILIAAVAAVTIQPLTPLPLSSGRTKGDRVANVVGRIASAGCAVDVASETVAVWDAPTVQSLDRWPLDDLRQRTRRTHDRCLPRRECFTNQSPVRTRRDPDRWFRTPTFLGK